MLSQEENQIAICLLKSNLEDIENELLNQSATWPEFDTENDQKYRDTLNILRVVRSLGEESEELHQKNVRLVARRVQIKRQSDDLKKALERACETRNEIESEMAKEEQVIEEEIRKYENCLHQKADRFREGKGYYDKAQINSETAKLEGLISNLEGEMNERKNSVTTLMKHLDELQPNVPDDLLTIVGKANLEEHVKIFEKECDRLQLQLNDLLKDSNTTLPITNK